VPENFLFRCRFTPAGRTQRFGLLLRTDDQLSSGYLLAIEPERQRFSLTSFGPEGKLPAWPAIRPLPCAPDQPFDVTVIFSGTIVEVFINDRAALVQRYYDYQGDGLGLYLEEGAGAFSDLRLRELPAETW
jgi:hypothetical protein